MATGTFRHWNTHLAKATWLVSTRGSANPNLLHSVQEDKVPVVHVKDTLGKTVWAMPASGKGEPIRAIAFAQRSLCTWWVIVKNGEIQCVPQEDLMLGKNSP